MPVNSWAEWFDLDKQLEHMDGLGHQVDVVCSIGPLSVAFSDLAPPRGATWRSCGTRRWRARSANIRAGSGPAPRCRCSDTRIAIEVLDHAINKLGLMGANLPGSVGSDPRIDHERLEPFYDRVEELGVPLFLHPTDAVFEELLEGYNGALHLSLGRVIEVSAAASRLILSGIMERHPKLKIVMSHTGGALPYQSGRMDKNTKAALLPQPMSSYIKRMYTDTVSPHVPGMKFAIEYFGIDNVMYGTDYPCWDPATALKLLDEIALSPADKQKLFYDNARRILGLRDPVQGKAGAAAGSGAGLKRRFRPSEK